MVIVFVLFMAYLALLEPHFGTSLGALSDEAKLTAELRSTREEDEEENRLAELAGVEKLLEEVVVLQKQHQQRLKALEDETHSAIESLKEQGMRKAGNEQNSTKAKQTNTTGRFCIHNNMYSLFFLVFLHSLFHFHHFHSFRNQTLIFSTQRLFKRRNQTRIAVIKKATRKKKKKKKKKRRRRNQSCTAAYWNALA